MDNINEFAYCQRLKDLRNAKGWSLQEAATLLEVEKATLNGYETVPETYTNGRKNAGRKPPIDFLLKACEVYGVTTDYLVGRVDIPAINLDNAAIGEMCGLIKPAVEALIEHGQKANARIRLRGVAYIQDIRIMRAVNALLESEQGRRVLKAIASYCFEKNERNEDDIQKMREMYSNFPEMSDADIQEIVDEKRELGKAEQMVYISHAVEKLRDSLLKRQEDGDNGTKEAANNGNKIK